MIKRFGIFCVILGLFSFAGCAKTQEKAVDEIENSVEEVIENAEEESDNLQAEIIDEKPEEEDKEPANTEKRRIAVYVRGYDKHNDIVMVDEVEWLTLEDEEKLIELGIDPESFYDGYYINNPYDKIDEYKITEGTSFSCIDYETAESFPVSKDDWYLNVTNSAIYWLRLSGDEIESIEEQYLP